MKILLLTAYFPPDTGSAAHLFYELGTELVKRGHQVSVITNLPGYHAQGDLDKYKGDLWHGETVNGMHVLRIVTPRLPPRLMVGRALWQFSMAFMFWLAGMLSRRHDVVMLYSPPLTLGVAAWGMRLFKSTPFILNVQDLFPQSIIDLGLLSNATIIRFFETMERVLYRQADAITVHSEGNRQHVISVAREKARVSVVPNWVDTDFIQPGERVNGFRHELGVDENPFIISFAGVLGYSQDLDVVLAAAQQLKDHKDISWVIVGDGVEKERLQTKSHDMDLDGSISFVPMQPREKYPAILHASDLCLATLHAEVKTPVVPSKILSIMAAGKPVVAAMNLEGDAPRLVDEAQCGYCLPPEDPQALAETVLSLYRDAETCQRMGANGRAYAERNLSLKACVGRYEELLERVAG